MSPAIRLRSCGARVCDGFGAVLLRGLSSAVPMTRSLLSSHHPGEPPWVDSAELPGAPRTVTAACGQPAAYSLRRCG